MSIKYDDKTAKLIQNKTVQQNAGGVEIGRIEIATYNIEDILTLSQTSPGFYMSVLQVF